jgi:predicted DNA-binding antitoxin AbrB/MazE fold protein
MRIKAIYSNNVLKPLESLDLKEGEEVEIEVRRSMKNFHGRIEIEKEIADEIIEMEVWS